MTRILNILWFLLGGGLLALGWLLAAGLMALTVVGLPWARSALVIARMAATPFGVEAVDRDLLTGRSDLGTGPLGVVGNVVWFFLAGLWLAACHVGLAVACALSVVGLPFALAHLRLADLSIFPVGKTVVDKALAAELRRRAAGERLETLRRPPPPWQHRLGAWVAWLLVGLVLAGLALAAWQQGRPPLLLPSVDGLRV